ncbi:hypothetical protein D3C75_1180140 [compost metagenome]
MIEQIPEPEGDERHGNMENKKTGEQRQRFFEHIHEIFNAQADASGKGHKSKQPGRQKGIVSKRTAAEHSGQHTERCNQRHHPVKHTV